MKIAIFSTHPTYVTHLETELELAQEFIDKDYEVDFYVCNDQSIKCCDNVLAMYLNNSDTYNETSFKVCTFCIQRQTLGFNLLKGNFELLPLVSPKHKSIQYSFHESFLESIDKFKELIYDDCFDVGWAILSSLISYTKNPFLDLKEYKQIIIDLYNESIKIYETAKENLAANNYDQIFVFNGRLSYTRGLYRLGRSLNIKTLIHERGSVPEKYEIYENTTPHNIINYYKRINEYWSKGSFFSRYKYGHSFFKKKIEGFGGSWETFTTRFKKDCLPLSFNPKNKNIVLFTSSEDEFASIDSTWDNPFFKNQLNGIEYLCKEINNRKLNNEFLYIRVHPNSRLMNENYLDKLFSFSKYSNVEIIYPESDINSYTLMFNSYRVITFGSTMTIESVYWGKATILLANCEFNQFNGPITPKVNSEIIELCFEKKLPKPSKKDAVKIGYYLLMYGKNYKYYEAVDYQTGYFKGVNLSTGDVLQIKESKITYNINRIKGLLFEIYKLLNKFIFRKNV